MLLQLHKLVT